MFHLAWFIPLVGAVTATYILHVCMAGTNFAQTYADKFRPSLFTGFLTTGSFLLALKTFILVRMDADVYSSEAYRDVFERSLKHGNTESLYAPLERLGKVLFLAIVSAFGTSLLQFTVGLVPYDLAAFLCVGAAFFTMGTLFVCLVAVRSNLNTWFAMLHERKPKPKAEPQATESKVGR